MATSTRAKPPAASRTRYEDDLYTWVQEQVALLRAGRWDEIDAVNVAEELADVGREQLHKLESSITVLAMHLLKWDFQPEHRSRSWQATINEQRRRIQRILKNNPGLKAKVQEAVSEVYPESVDRAVAETDLPYETFPATCPYSFEDMMARPVDYEPAPRPNRRRRTTRT